MTPKNDDLWPLLECMCIHVHVPTDMHMHTQNIGSNTFLAPPLLTSCISTFLFLISLSLSVCTHFQTFMYSAVYKLVQNHVFKHSCILYKITEPL